MLELRVLDARFLMSAPTLETLPPPAAPEVAFLGKSNVGKSSLLNTLLGVEIVKVSKTPGLTRAVNFFHVELGKRTRSGGLGERRALMLCDLPGYGYAEASKGERARMSALLSGYLGRREGLAAVVQIVDARHEPSREDRQVHDELCAIDVDRVVVMSKCDKLAKSKLAPAKKQVCQALGVADVLPFSSVTGTGRAELWARLWGHAA